MNSITRQRRSKFWQKNKEFTTTMDYGYTQNMCLRRAQYSVSSVITWQASVLYQVALPQCPVTTESSFDSFLGPAWKRRTD